MKTERLSSLALMHSHPSRLKSIKHEDILNRFLRFLNGGKSCYFVFVFLKKVDFKIEYLLKLHENN